MLGIVTDIGIVESGFGTLQLREYGATRTVRLVTSSLWFSLSSPFRSPFLGAPRGVAVTKSVLSPRGSKGIPVFTLRMWIES